MYYRAVETGRAGGLFLGRSANPIPTSGGISCPPYYYFPPHPFTTFGASYDPIFTFEPIVSCETFELLTTYFHDSVLTKTSLVCRFFVKTVKLWKLGIRVSIELLLFWIEPIRKNKLYSQIDTTNSICTRLGPRRVKAKIDNQHPKIMKNRIFLLFW